MNRQTFEQILDTEVSEAEKAQFLAEQQFLRSLEWEVKNLKITPPVDLWGTGA